MVIQFNVGEILDKEQLIQFNEDVKNLKALYKEAMELVTINYGNGLNKAFKDFYDMAITKKELYETRKTLNDTYFFGKKAAIAQFNISLLALVQKYTGQVMETLQSEVSKDG